MRTPCPSVIMFLISPFLGEAVALLIAVIGLNDRCDLTVRGKLYQALWRYIHDTLKRETAVELSNRRCGQYIRQSTDRRLEALHQLFPRRGKLLLREEAKTEKPLEDGKGKAEIGFTLKLILIHAYLRMFLDRQLSSSVIVEFKAKSLSLCPKQKSLDSMNRALYNEFKGSCSSSYPL